MVEIVSYRKQANGMYRVTYNGSIVGDDRAFSNRSEAETEARNRVEKDHADAARFNRPVMFIYRPGF